MYKDIKEKCEVMATELMGILPELVEPGTSRIKDVRAERLITDINSASNALHRVSNTIATYFSED